MGKQWKQWLTLFFWAPKSLKMVIATMKLKDTWKKCYDQPRQHIKKQRHCFVNKRLSSQGYGGGNGTPLQYSCLENPMDGGAS